MAWFYINFPRGTLKIKPRSHLRSDERARRVPVLDLGVVVLSWWSRARMERDLAEGRNRQSSWRQKACCPSAKWQ